MKNYLQVDKDCLDYLSFLDTLAESKGSNPALAQVFPGTSGCLPPEHE